MPDEGFDYTPRKRRGDDQTVRSPFAKKREEPLDSAQQAARRQHKDTSEGEYMPRPARRARRISRSSKRSSKHRRLFGSVNWGRLAALVALLVLVVPTILVVLVREDGAGQDPRLASLLAYLQENPDDYRTLVELGNYYSDQGWGWWNQEDVDQAQRDFQVATNYYERALQQDPTNASVHAALGMMYYYRGRLTNDMALIEEAIQTWQIVLSLQPDAPETLNNLGIAYSTLGQVDEAMAMWQRVIEVAPGSSSAEQAQEMIDQYAEP